MGGRLAFEMGSDGALNYRAALTASRLVIIKVKVVRYK